MSPKNDNTSSADSAADEEYDGPERRSGPAGEPAVRGEIRFDAKGNPVWEPRTDMPRRRKDDETFDLLKCLDVDSLSLEPDDDDAEPDVGAIEPYRRDER